ncbi:hypothetical protein LTR05_002922 [Lithohypha guttulata]|uniref:LysM domain-containing protein n=1 Tax=Lithohypha guttulata TaxID=1690604 RepID=A0AAN7T3C3_9EURO|nr:hypothetical protein LTR05_002922 [Lithohypha guttulata]
MEPKMHLSLLTLSCLILLCTTSYAKPVNHAKHIAMTGGNLAHVVESGVQKWAFRLRKTASVRSGSSYLSKRDSTWDSTWIVEAGDTGYRIAARLGVSFAQLSALNPGVQWNNLQIEQLLNIPCEDDEGTGSTSYTVISGDTGNAIAAAFGVSFTMLSAANPGVNWYNLRIGQVLNIPSEGDESSGSTIYTVVAGDTGNAISATYGISFSMLSASNPGVNWYNLQVGQFLVVPRPTVPESTTTTIETTSVVDTTSTATSMSTTSTSCTSRTSTTSIEPVESSTTSSFATVTASTTSSDVSSTLDEPTTTSTSSDISTTISSETTTTSAESTSTSFESLTSTTSESTSATSDSTSTSTLTSTSTTTDLISTSTTSDSTSTSTTSDLTSTSTTTGSTTTTTFASTISTTTATTTSDTTTTSSDAPEPTTTVVVRRAAQARSTKILQLVEIPVVRNN